MAPTLDAPESASTVRVRMIDTTSRMTIRSESFIQPVLQGHESLNITNVAFLIENKKLGRRVLFDAGVRKDYWNLPPAIQKRLGDVIPSLRVDQDVTEVLEEAGIQLQSIDTLIWSHHHWDHTGNPSLFPPSTALVLGPGLNARDAPKLLPGYPDNPNSPLVASDFAGRDVVEVSFSDGVTIGGFPARDFFGDNSFYLLDTPGHAIGHICGLARTTPDSFILLGGDICHFPGDLRPNPSHPLPDPIPDGVLDGDTYFPSPCPCSLFTDLHPSTSATAQSADPTTTPFFSLSTHQRSAYINPPLAQQSVNTLRSNFDQISNVFVCLAHDPALVEDDVLPTLNASGRREEDLNEWVKKGWKESLYWRWLNELPRAGREGRPRLVEGFWRDGKRWNREKEKL